MITTTGNIDIYCHHVFSMRYEPNQSYSTEYITGCSFTIFHGGVKGRIVKVKLSQSN